MTKHRVTRRLLAVALSVLLVLGCVAPAVAATYESGTYTGTGTGRNGSVALTLTLTNGAIASVDNVTHSETARYWEKAKVLLDRLVGLQTPEQVEKLDAVTGATLSSNAIKEAAKDVFRQAESKETPVFASGSGTKSDPYLIRTAAQLQAFAAAVNGGTGYEGQYISLDADLDLTGTAWTPIGATGSFNGSFNGNYHTITGMTIGSEREGFLYGGRPLRLGRQGRCHPQRRRYQRRDLQQDHDGPERRPSGGRDQREQHRRELLGDRHDLQRYDFSLLFLRRRPRRQHRHQEPHLQQLDERCRLCQGQL